QYYLIDIATDMLEVAQKRFNNLDNFHFLDMDYTNVLPENDFDVIISILTMNYYDSYDSISNFFE
ncbi:MAG: class I SAM-dependent methyltransferase, partial [Muribaculaceae bacterium]|nr:class I SAM-dependent methyltransferase [Muribaculaceae bacterium]